MKPVTVMTLALIAVAAYPQTRPRAPAPITFNKQVLPILQGHCQTCHRPGEAVPFAMMDYASTRPWAKAIKRAVLERTMPPWFADPAFGHFANDRRLAESDVKTLVAWVDSGAVEGDPKDKPVLRQWKDGWSIQPDVTLQMPQPYGVPATGTLQYAYFVIPTGFKEDTWVTAGEIRPGARGAIHHINAIVRPPESAWMRTAKPGVPYIPDAAARDGYPDSTDPQAALMDETTEFLVGYAPGMQAQRFDIDQSAKLIPAGSDIVLQIHYTANGKTAVEDLTKVGLTLARQVPVKRYYTPNVLSWKWEIPAGDPNYEARAKLTLGEPVELVSIQPHMHLRGKDMTVNLVYPTGESETVLRVPRYRYDWQVIYYLDKPRRLPSGTRVEVTAHWDNSANNPNNPDPARAVRWGNQSWEEMLSVPLGVLVDRD